MPQHPIPTNTLTTEEVLQVHEALIQDFATTRDPISPPGVKDQHLLESAVARQYAGHRDELLHPDPVGNASTLLYGLCCNHPFHNGNKRTALVSMLVHLDKNKLTLFDTNQDDLYDLMLKVANHSLGQKSEKLARYKRLQRPASDVEVAVISQWISQRVSRLSRGEKLITYRELRKILSSFGYVLENPHDNSIEIVRYNQVKKGIFIRKMVTERTHIWTMSWPGENRQVSINEIKSVRQKCGLREEDGCDSGSFYNYGIVVDTFVNHYRRTLRRLAHA